MRNLRAPIPKGDRWHLISQWSAHKGAIISIDNEVRCMVEVVSEMFAYSPLKSEKLKLSGMEEIVLFRLG